MYRHRHRFSAVASSLARAGRDLAVVAVAAAGLLLAGCSELPEEFTLDGAFVGEGGVSPDPDAGPRPDGTPPQLDQGPKADAPAPPPPGVFDWRDAVMYFVMLDRFADGDSSNNNPEANVQTPANWQGGDLAGLLAKLKSGYFTQLGVNVLWLSSPVDTPGGRYLGVRDPNYYSGYHGYWPGDLTKVEEHLGDLALLKQVVDEAHKQKIKVLFDYVMNHVHELSPTYASNPGWFWPNTKDGGDCICGGNCSWAEPDGLKCWFDPFLPDFNFTLAPARKFSIDNAIKWIKDTGIDGFRLDAVKHIEMSWLTELRARVEKEIPKASGARFYMVGETFDGDKNVLKKYVNPQTMLDGQFDFPLRAEMVKVILARQGSFGDLHNFLDSNDGFYGAGAIMGTFLGNHDIPRSIHFAEDSPLWNDVWTNGKDRAWTNQPGAPANSSAYERLGLGFTALMTLPGVPLIYYGDEVGMAGAGDPDNRRFMQWSGTTPAQDTLRTLIGKLTKIRAQHEALRYGTRKGVVVQNDVYAYEMSHSADKLTVVLNRSDSSKSITLPGSSYQDLLSSQSYSSNVTVPARTGLILQ
jgi:glycosidase